MNPAVEFDHVSKLFRLRDERPRSFQEAVIRAFQRQRTSSTYELWVLRDVNLTVPAG
ncbi:MAG: ABC transporter ATP-binding protein, partial [Chloroflexota bacterium]